METVTDFIQKCCTEEENADALVQRACTSIVQQGNTIVNILAEQEKWIGAKKGKPPLLSPSELVEVLDKTDALGAALVDVLKGCSNLQDLL